MTGSIAPGSGSGDQTLTVSHSSPTAAADTSPLPNASGCGTGGPNEKASRTPSQPRTGRGAAKRSSPTGASANGMPRNTATPSSRLPRSAPATVRTSVIVSFPPVRLRGHSETLPAPGTLRIVPTDRDGCQPFSGPGRDAVRRNGCGPTGKQPMVRRGNVPWGDGVRPGFDGRLAPFLLVRRPERVRLRVYMDASQIVDVFSHEEERDDKGTGVGHEPGTYAARSTGPDQPT